MLKFFAGQKRFIDNDFGKPTFGNVRLIHQAAFFITSYKRQRLMVGFASLRQDALKNFVFD